MILSDSPEFRALKYGQYLAQTNRNPICLSSVFIDPRLLPIKKIEKTILKLAKSHRLSKSNDPQGNDRLRIEIAKRLKKASIGVEPEELILTHGSQQAIDLVTRAMTGRVVATEDPPYFLARSLFEVNQKSMVGLPVCPFTGVDKKKWLKQIETKKPALVYLTSRFQNPSGYSYTEFELQWICEQSAANHFRILEDDWASDMMSSRTNHKSLRQRMGSSVFYMNSFTKKLFPGLRVGYLVANKASLEPLMAVKRASTSSVSGILEQVLCELMVSGDYDEHLAELQVQVQKRYEASVEALEKMKIRLGRREIEFNFTRPMGGSVLWVGLSKKSDTEKLAHDLLKESVRILAARGGFKLGFAFLSEREMKKALQIVERLLLVAF